MEIIRKYLTDEIHGTLFILKSHILNCVPIGENVTDSKKDAFIQDIPSIKRLLQQCEELKAIKRDLPRMSRAFKLTASDVIQIEKAIDSASDKCCATKDLAAIIDKFDDLLSDNGWIAYSHMDINAIKGAVQKADSGDIAGAEADLIRHYNADRVKFELRITKRLDAFRERRSLAMKALDDYENKRYHACIPVVLALLDGMVNEVYYKVHKKRYGFFAEDVDLIAWDSIAGHSKGLNKLAKAFRRGRYKTTTDPISIPYRNGILHGMDLGYANEAVAAKTWAALFAASEWASRAERGLLTSPSEIQKTPMETILEALHQHRITEEERARISAWRPRSIKPGLDIPSTGEPGVYEDRTPEQAIAEFFSYWKVKKYGCMAKHVPRKPDESVNALAGRVRRVFDDRHLHSFEIQGICDVASAVTVLKVKLIYEVMDRTMERPFEFFMINCDTSGKISTRGNAESDWYIRNWDRNI
jgi:hypothetical protein